MKRNEKLKTALSLFFYFFRIGWFTFGGGWSIVSQIQNDYVEKKKAIKSEELLDIVSVGRSLPGTMIGNVAYLFGYDQAGVLGGLLSLLGIVLPPLIMLSVLTYCYQNVRDNTYVEKALIGVRAAVVPIIVTAAVKLRKDAFPEKMCYVLCVLAVILSAVFKVNCVFLVLGGVISGFVMGLIKKRRMQK